MRYLLLGGGGREHALAWRLAQEGVDVVAAPGNPGMAKVARVVPVDLSDSVAVVEMACAMAPDLVICGPEAPLAAGLADRLGQRGLLALGPSAAGARLEASKAYSRSLMSRLALPCPPGGEASCPQKALRLADDLGYPVVIKADGLAGGKGSIVCPGRPEAQEAVEDLMIRRCLGSAGERVVVESYIPGPEASLFALADGDRVMLLGVVRDYKTLREGGQGPNTGGMGAVCPVLGLTDKQAERWTQALVSPVVQALAEAGSPYRGVLYAGLKLTDQGPCILEWNVRLGDPEAQALLPLLGGRLSDMLMASAQGDLAGVERPGLSGLTAVTVVLAAPGYPARPETGDAILGLEALEGSPDVMIFHAGTRREGERLVTAGGRVLAITALAPGVDRARDRAYGAAKSICWPGLQLRRDIGH